MSVPHELRSTICPNCGYSLEGLCLETNCPECGRAQDPSEIVLHGYAHGNAPRPATRSRAFVTILFYVGGLLLFCWLVRARDWWFLIFIAVSYVVEFLKRVDRRHPGLVQVRIYPAGVAQFEHAGGATLLRKWKVAYAWIIPVSVMVFLLSWLLVQRSTPVLIIFVPAFFLAALFSFTTVPKALRYYRAWSDVPENAIVDFNMAFHGLTPWSAVDKLVLEPTKSGRYRLQINRPFRYRAFDVTAGIVDAEVELNEYEAGQLSSLLRSWIADSRREYVARETKDVEGS